MGTDDLRQLVKVFWTSDAADDFHWRESHAMNYVGTLEATLTAFFGDQDECGFATLSFRKELDDGAWYRPLFIETKAAKVLRQGFSSMKIAHKSFILFSKHDYAMLKLMFTE